MLLRALKSLPVFTLFLLYAAGVATGWRTRTFALSVTGHQRMREKLLRKSGLQQELTA